MTGPDTPTYLIDLPQFRDSAAALADAHPELRPYADPARLREWKKLPAGFAGLCDIVIGQQVSTTVAETLCNRFADLMEGDVTPQRVLGHDMETLRGIGLSRQKSSYITGLAEAITEGRFNPTALADMDEDAAMAELVKLKGIGPWSAEIYLMFALGKKNIWPAGDLGIQLGMQMLKNLKDKPSQEETRDLAHPWHPHRSAAALMVWRCYIDKKSV